MITTPLPAFVAEVRDQARAAHEARMTALSVGDDDTVETATARLADLADILKSYASDLAAVLEVSTLLEPDVAEQLPLRAAG